MYIAISDISQLKFVLNMRFLPLSLLLICFSCTEKHTTNKSLTFYIGTYTQHEGHVDGHADGIYKMTFDPETLELSITDTINGMVNPSFLAISDNDSILYAVNEISPGGETKGIFEAYQIFSGNFGNRLFSRSTEAYAPCQIALNGDESVAVVCNYVGGVVSVYNFTSQDSIQSKFIELPSVPRASPRQESSHPHSAQFSLNGKQLYVADLGTDRVMVYDVKEGGGELAPASPPFVEFPEAFGPRHMTLSADGKILYVLGELSHEVAVLDIAENGELTQKQLISTLPANEKDTPNTTADIHLSADGTRLFSSNRGHNSIACFDVMQDGTLKNAGFVSSDGLVPRNFCLTRDGNWMLVANQNSDNVSLFDIRGKGLPVLVKKIQVSTPVCVVETSGR